VRAARGLQRFRRCDSECACACCVLTRQGLKPGLFHSNKEQLLSVDRDDLPDLVDELVTGAKADAVTHAMGDLSLATGHSESTPGLSATTSPSLVASHLSAYHPTGVPGPSSRLALAIGPPISSSAWSFPTSPSCSAIHYVRVVPIDKVSKNETPQWILLLTQDTSVFVCPVAKSDLKGYTHSVAALVNHVRRRMRDGSSGVILCPGGKVDLETAKRLQQLDAAKSPARLPETTHQPLPPADVDSRKLILPLALALILAIPSISQPDLQPDSDADADSDSEEADEMPEITKAEIADVLHGLVSLWPDGNPPRAALKRVNQYLMSEGWE
jgi:tRNA A64-2'-O-ribosylphosphate transferase